MACSSYKQKSQHCQKEQSYRYTDQGQIGMIAPTTTLTPQGPADTGYAGGYWQFNTQGELVRVHRQHRKTLFTPSRTQCPVPAEQLEDYRKTTIRLKDGTTNTFEDKYQTMEVPNRAQPQMWKGETTFRIKKGTTLPEAIQQQLATKTQPKSAPQKVTPQVIQYRPRTRLKEKTTPPTVQGASAPHTTKGVAGQGLPHPSEVHHGGDYWYREGPYWKRVHIEPRAAFSIPEQTHDGPDIRRLTPWRQTKVQPVGEARNTRLVEDEWTTQQAKTSDKPWTGWANFEERQEFPTQLESDDEEQQQGTRAKAVQAPKHPTPQEILEHNATHLPYRSWCPICVQARGRQNNYPKQHSKLPIIQLDFGYIRGFDDNKVHPILTAIDIQSGMIMAIQLSDKRMLFDYAVTQLQHFLIECGRTTHTQYYNQIRETSWQRSLQQ